MNKKFRDFRRHFHKVRKLKQTITSQGSFSLNISAQENIFSTRFDMPSEEISVQFAVLMRRFLAPNSDLYYVNIIDLIKEETPDLVTQDVDSLLQSHILSMNKGQIRKIPMTRIIPLKIYII